MATRGREENQRVAFSASVVSAVAVALVIACVGESFAFSPIIQSPAQRRRTVKKPEAPAEATPPVSSQEALDQAKAAPTQKERIALLEKFIVAPHDAALDGRARELLMQEYALSGEQHLRDADPQLAAKDFKAGFRAAPAVINDKIFGQYIFPLPMAMNAFGFRVESVELMRSFEPHFAEEPNRLVEIGFFYVQIEAPLEAVRVLEQAVKLARDDHRAHNGLGTAYLINLRLSEAVSEFERSTELDPKDEYANGNLANLARASGDYERAIDYYHRQIAIKVGDSDAHGGLAIALLAVGRDEDAEREIKRATELGPTNYHFLTQLAYFYAARKKPALARQQIENAIRIEPRYAWAYIVKANLDALEGKLGDALSTLIATQNLGKFSTLNFELVKTLMALDGYDQALEVMAKGFTVNHEGEFETTLGGVLKMRSPRLDLLIERERLAALYLADQPATSMQYRLAEALARIQYYSKMAATARKPAEPQTGRRRGRGTATRQKPESANREDEGLKTATRPRRVAAGDAVLSNELTAGRDADLPGMPQLIRALTTFTTLDDGRQAFRMVWAARVLSDSGVALDAAEQLARRAITVADAATEPEGSMRDAPLLDREGRRAVFLGRAQDALGWILFKKGDATGGVESLTKAAEAYPECPEKKNVFWHLAIATQEIGNEKRALDLYIASYEADLPTASLRRAQIEALYKKLNGSLDGLEDKLKKQ